MGAWKWVTEILSGRPDRTPVVDDDDDPVAYNMKIARGLREKADHNKFESQLCFSLVIGASLTSPLFVTLGSDLFWGKIVPASLSLVAAGATSWLQLRKPQKLWALYRSAQRHLEHERTQHRYKLGEYEQAADPAKLLAANSAKIAIDVHYRWEGLVPDPDSLGTAIAGGLPVKEKENAGAAR